jgi:hypothetical protein
MEENPAGKMNPYFKEIVLLLPAEKYAVLGNVRCIPGLLAAIDDQHLWLRGISTAEKTDPLLLQLPAIHTWWLDEQEQLFPPNGLTPIATLKKLRWQSLPELLPVTLPASAMPAVLPNPLRLQLEACSTPQNSDALLTTFSAWHNYGTTAPEVRLQALSFAASAGGKVLITGHPLPPVPGKEYVLQHQLLLPAGYSFAPAGIAAIVSQQLNPAQTDLLLFHTNGTWECIPATAFVKASRSAIRLTKRELDNG